VKGKSNELKFLTYSRPSTFLAREKAGHRRRLSSSVIDFPDPFAIFLAVDDEVRPWF
jgi:hypothetical protein